MTRTNARPFLAVQKRTFINMHVSHWQQASDALSLRVINLKRFFVQGRREGREMCSCPLSSPPDFEEEEKELLPTSPIETVD